jgi:hypothetical protein
MPLILEYSRTAAKKVPLLLNFNNQIVVFFKFDRLSGSAHFLFHILPGLWLATGV